ncbi:HgcAB-associated protein HgcC [Candidatus Solincola tengchongensis]|uniref:HgcAB-associated protein HgcC n=1 Tax=Candidatus Solincola tengchongensis TaxID=2900693 RepID=UPI00257ED6A7|nr:HgcAB-associated protein [Candidatus Solincola tengchongensis]
MGAKKVAEACCPVSEEACCRVETLVGVDERGQMVLPKDFRERAGIKAGDKLALVSWESEGKICCVLLMRAEELGALVKERLGPVLRGLL